MKAENMKFETQIPPQNIDMEKSVLGSLMQGDSFLEQGMDCLKPEYFYNNCNKLIFEAILNLYKRSSKVDLLLVCEELKRMKNLQQIGGESYLTELFANISTFSNISSHAEILKQCYKIRTLASTTAILNSECYKPEVNAYDIINKAEAEIFKISVDNNKSEPVGMLSLTSEFFEELEKIKNEGISGITTGFEDLDKITTGLHGSELIIVAGRPGSGKTSFVLSMACKIATDLNKKSVLFFSLEMNKNQLMLRIMSSEAKIDMQRLRCSSHLSKTEMMNLNDAASKLMNCNIFIDDTASLNIMELRSKARKFKALNSCDVLIIDYLQLMSSTEKSETRNLEITAITRSLKILAKELNIPIIVLSQLSRKTEDRNDSRPKLSDLRESGAIEQDADIVIFVYRESQYKKDDETLKGIAELIIGKQRNGPTGTVKLAFIEEFAKFENLDLEHLQNRKVW